MNVSWACEGVDSVWEMGLLVWGCDSAFVVAIAVRGGRWNLEIVRRGYPGEGRRGSGGCSLLFLDRLRLLDLVFGSMRVNPRKLGTLAMKDLELAQYKQG